MKHDMQGVRHHSLENSNPNKLSRIIIQIHNRTRQAPPSTIKSIKFYL